MKKIQIILLSVVLTFSLMPIHNFLTVQAETSQNDLIVNASTLNLREGPGLSYPVLLSLKKDESLTTLKKSGDWIQVQVNGETGWVAAWLTKTVSNKATQTETQSKTVISQVDFLNIRVEPSLSANVVAQLSVGNEARFIKETEEWIQIDYQNKTGWVHKKYASISIDEQVTSVTKDTSEESKATSTNIFTVNVDAVNIRKKPDLNTKKLGTIKNGEQYDVLSRDGNWIEIEYSKGKKGWVYSFYGTFSTTKTPSPTSNASKDTANSVTIIYDGTNLREEPSTASNVVKHVNLGEVFTIIESLDEWYKIALPNNQHAYVANWVVNLNQGQAGTINSTKTPKTQRKKGTLNGLTIVIDPGHGGNDHGTTGVRGTAEKGINLITAELLTSKLRSAGANVVLTRESDKYVDLRKRVAVSHQNNADAFISIHYDASETASVSGFTTYYTNSNQKKLAQAVHNGLASKVTLRDRGAQPGNYLVLRENRQAAILLELGYLSNSSEERAITTDFYREQATLGIYNGLLNYFDDLLN